jgi:two-component system LytT family response regulator
VDSLRPELLLLDIHLAGGTGFDLLDRVDHVPLVIFTTAYDHHAVDAFERNALDYLLKPIAPERLGQALQRARDQGRAALASPDAAPAPAPRKGADDTVFVRDGERGWFVRLADISGFEAYGNYARVWFNGQQPLLARTLGHLEERLDHSLFFRASRSQLINLRWVSSITPWVNDGYQVTLRDGREIEVSRRQAKVLRERLEL